jgi:hypothetical protein
MALAAAYLKAGRREEAVAVLQQTAICNPSFRDQANHSVAEIRAGRSP